MGIQAKKWRVVTKATDAQPKIRMSFEMREALKEKAFENGRTFNNEILYRLARTLTEEDLLKTKGENYENI